MDPNSGKKNMFNKLSKKQCLDLLEKETFSRVTVSFYKYVVLENLENLISVPTKDGKYIYMTQKYNSYSQAKTKLIEINQLGYEDAYIVKF